MIRAGVYIAGMAMVSIMLAAAVAAPATEPDDETILQVRAAFLLNFMKFTTWPDDAFASEKSDLVLGIIGNDPFGDVLEQTFARQQVGHREVTIERWSIPDPDAFDEEEDYMEAVAQLRLKVQHAHLAYFPDCRTEALDLIIKDADLSRVLTVGHRRACAERGTALALGLDGDRIVFYANVRIIESLDLQVSSRLMSLARIVEDKRPGRQGGGR